MWSLILLVYLSHGALGMTHLDNFKTEKMCERAGYAAMIEAKKINDRKIKAQYICIHEID